MVLSPYVKSYPYPEKPGTLLVFSARKASMCVLPEALFRGLERGEVPEGAGETLTRLGVLVADAQAERQDMLGYLDRVNRLSSCLAVAVFLGMECNFRCTYCYEGSLKGRSSMSDATAERLVEFVRDRVGPGIGDVILDFYGGEPLLYTERIVQLSRALRPLAEERGARYAFTLVTNGSLLTPSVVGQLVPLGLRGIKLTLDGPAENHDRFRPFRSGKGSFETIFRNVQACCELTRIGIGGNYTRDNYRLFPKLLDQLVESGLGPERIPQIHFGPVMQTTDGHAPPEFYSGCASICEPWLAEASLFLREEVLKRGYRVPKLSPNPCMADMENALVVHWDGTLTKCPGLIGNARFVAGDLWNGFRDYREPFGVGRLEKAAECRECEYLPLCFGGCRYMKYQREGHMTGIDCQRSYLDATLEALLFQEARYRMAAKG